MNERDILTLELMDRYGGSFIRCIAEAFLHADLANFKKLKQAFSEYWAEYEKMADNLLDKKNERN